MDLKEKQRESSLPEKNRLPLKVQNSKHLAEHGDSVIHDIIVKTQKNLEQHIVLKQIRETQFATLEEMKLDKQFYESLKNSPLGKFIPDTHHFIGKMTEKEPAQGFRIQNFIEGKTIDVMTDKEIYEDPIVVNQLLELTKVAIEILKKADKENTHLPDFRRPLHFDNFFAIIGGLLLNPRYTKNIVIADKPDQKGQRVFFVDTGINFQERTVSRKKKFARSFVNPVEQWYFEHWQNKLKKIKTSI